MAHTNRRRVMTVRAVLFDLGGTLLHYMEPHTTFLDANIAGLTAMHGFLRRAGYPVPAVDAFVSSVGQFTRTTNQTLEAAGRGGCVDDTFRAALHQLKLNVATHDWPGALWCYYGTIQRFVHPIDGDARQVLQTLDAAGLKLGLISNTWWSPQLHDADLGHAGLLEFLPVRIYSSSLGYVKPRLEIFAAGLAALGCLPHETVYVGDRLLIDVGGAQAAGMRGVLIELDHRVEQDTTVHADARLTQLDELPGLIARWQEAES